MIIINGKVFRNLEEQVAYLSEVIPLFEVVDGQLIIKQGNGTEIAEITLDAVSNMSVSTVNDITTITITNADSSVSTYTIDMSGYLKKVSTQTQVMQAYIKQTDGSQQMVFVHWDNIRDTIPIRDQTGNIRVALVPTTNTHAASKKYVDDAVKKYIHYITATFTDGCDETYSGIFILQLTAPYDTAITNLNDFKQLFNLYGELLDGYVILGGRMCQQYGKGTNYYHSPCLYYYDSENDCFLNSLGDYSSNLTLTSLTDEVREA